MLQAFPGYFLVDVGHECVGWCIDGVDKTEDDVVTIYASDDRSDQFLRRGRND
jgi:hypothetical protein